MGVDRTTLVAAARAERAGLGRTIQYAPPESWEQPSACPGWWNRDVMAHLAAQDYAAAQLLAGEDPTELVEYRASLGDEPFTTDGFNERVVNARSGLAYREVLTHWGRAADLVCEGAADLPDEDWNDRRVDWLAGDIGIPYLLQSRVVEWWVHGEDVRAGAGMPERVEHWPIYLTSDLAIRMLPWSLSQAGLDLRGLSVQIDLEGAGLGSWRYGLGAGEVPDPDAKPDAWISGRAKSFALVAARRLDLDGVLDVGNLVVGGEEELGIAVLRALRAYP
ncbi:MAG: maleylpyruvate isomerase family mycothiol-dependent enzyme [Actinomycetota bacterium]